ncbi:MAG TPA: hypothetical protein VKV40_25550 [Ktedonobacteraceae bacterium]|nr:hypothetical protein [Ktedonobacteraceae bacterium]
MATNTTADVQHTPTVLGLEHGKQAQHLFSWFVPVGAKVSIVP